MEDNPLLRWAALGELAIASILVLWPAFPTATNYLRVAAAGLLVLLLPGYLLRRILLPTCAWSLPSRLGLDFALSLGAAFLAWLAALAFGGTLNAFAFSLAGLLVIESGWLGVKGIRRDHEAGAQATIGGLPIAVVGVIAAFWALVALGQGALFMPDTDNWYYLAGVRHIAATERLLPGDPYFEGAADPQRGSPWLAIAALLARLGAISPAALWDILPVLILPLAICTHFLLGETLFRDGRAAALSCVFLLYGFGRFTWDVPMMVVSPAGIAFILFLAACALTWVYFEQRVVAALPLTLLLLAACAGTHLLVVLGYVLLLGSYGGLHMLLRRDGRYALRVGALLAASIVIVALLAGPWLGSGPGSTNAIYADEWGVVGQVAGWRFIKPGALMGSGFSPWALAFLLAPLLVLLAKDQNWAIWLLASMLAVLATAFNPLFVEAAVRSGLLPPWGVWRLALQVFQFQFVLGGVGALGLAWWIAAGGKTWGWSRVTSLVVLCVVGGLALLPSSVPLLRPMGSYVRNSAAVLTGAQPRLRTQVAAELKGVLEAAPPGSVVLSDPQTGYFIGAISNHFVPAITYGHSAPGINDDDRRREDVGLVLDPKTPQAQVIPIMERYGVDFVLLTAPEPAYGKYTLTPGVLDALKTRFDGDGAHFQRVESAASHTMLYRYLPSK